MPKTAFLFGSKRAEGNISAAQTSKTGLSAHGPKSKERSPSSLCICCEHFLHQGTPGCRTWDWIEALQVSLRDVSWLDMVSFQAVKLANLPPSGGKADPSNNKNQTQTVARRMEAPRGPEGRATVPRDRWKVFDIGGWQFCTC